MDKKRTTSRPSKVERDTERTARERAEKEKMRVTSTRFSQAIEEYTEWQAFALWVRTIEEAEGELPPHTAEALRNRCPGFLECESEYRETHPQEPPFLWMRLIEWIHRNVFRYAQDEGWFHALGFYALREARLKRLMEYWRQCEAEWKSNRPGNYPSFNEWFKHATGAGATGRVPD
jgi:hypothetical protein